MDIETLLKNLRKGKVKIDHGEPAPEEIVVQKNNQPRQAGATMSNGEYVAKYRKEAEKSLYVFAKGILGFKLLTAELHGELCQFLTTFPPQQHFTNLYGEKMIQPARFRKMCLIPKDHYKTSVASLSMPMHMLIQSKDGNIYLPGAPGNETKILLCGETEDLASKNLRWIEGQYENNTKLKAFWPESCWENPRAQAKKWNESRMIVRRKRDYPDESIRALGVGGAVQGYHPNCIIKDDMATFEASQSHVVMQNVKDWHRSSRSLFDQPRSDIEVIIGTPWSLNDVYQDIETPNSSIYDPTVEVYKRSIVEDGKPILPYKFDLTDVERMQKEFGALFSLLYMCKPYDPSLVDFDANDLRYFDIQDGYLHFDEDERDAEIVGLLKKAGRQNVRMPPPGADLRGQPLNIDTYRMMKGDGHLRDNVGRGYKREDWFKR